jgi:hypothetical protein
MDRLVDRDPSARHTSRLFGIAQRIRAVTITAGARCARIRRTSLSSGFAHPQFDATQLQFISGNHTDSKSTARRTDQPVDPRGRFACAHEAADHDLGRLDHEIGRRGRTQAHRLEGTAQLCRIDTAQGSDTNSDAGNLVSPVLARDLRGLIEKRLAYG